MKIVTTDGSGKAEGSEKQHTSLPTQFITECQLQLIEKKEELLGLSQTMKREYQHRDKSGDEVDLSLDNLAENHFFASLERLNYQLLEVEHALARIENGNFGICEETEEYIEQDRLRAIPWTRLSIEGAELREALQKRFVR